MQCLLDGGGRQDATRFETPGNLEAGLGGPRLHVRHETWEQYTSKITRYENKHFKMAPPLVS